MFLLHLLLATHKPGALREVPSEHQHQLTSADIMRTGSRVQAWHVLDSDSAHILQNKVTEVNTIAPISYNYARNKFREHPGSLNESP